MSTDDFIEVLIVLSALRVVTCFLDGDDTSRRDLKNGVFLKKIRFI